MNGIHLGLSLDQNVALIDRLAFIERGRAVRRYHTADVLDMQRIDAHSFGVAMLTTIIAPNVGAARKGLLLMAALVHDLAEHRTGDLPAPAKRELGMREHFNAHENKLLFGAGLFVQLDAADSRVIKLADAGDGCLHCIKERRMGNLDAPAIFYNFWSYMTEEQEFRVHSRPGGTEEGEEALHRYITTEWTRSNGKW